MKEESIYNYLKHFKVFLTLRSEFGYENLNGIEEFVCPDERIRINVLLDYIDMIKSLSKDFKYDVSLTFEKHSIRTTDDDLIILTTCKLRIVLGCKMDRENSFTYSVRVIRLTKKNYLCTARSRFLATGSPPQTCDVTHEFGF